MNNELPLSALKLTAPSTNALSSAPGRWHKADGLAVNSIEPVAWPQEWLDTDYREAAMEANVANMIAWQVRVNREERGFTQAELAKLMDTKQSAISRLEDPDAGDVKVSTLVRAAHAFRCAVIVKFVDYAEHFVETQDVRPDRLYAAPFSAETWLMRATSQALLSGPLAHLPSAIANNAVETPR
jgi:transcriptional regulator with XRE-family HTH domain